jgi:uncharacterized protein YcbK (DUF882 family)
MLPITRSIRVLASILKLAAALTVEDFKTIVQKLHDILQDEKNFDTVSETPLKFSPAGLQKLNIEGYDFRKQTDMMAVLKRLALIATFASKTGDRGLIQLLKNLNKPGHWVNVDLKDKDFAHAQTHVTRNALEFALDQAKREVEPEKKPTLTPEELQEMKDRGTL